MERPQLLMADNLSRMIDRSRLTRLLERERASFAIRNPRSREAYGAARNLFGRVPMTWMNKSAGGFPLYGSKAPGAGGEDIDGDVPIAFCLRARAGAAWRP